MIRKQLILDVNEEIIFDGFAGGGGWSHGEEAALGRHVDHAANHDAQALGMHRINHPQTVHWCEDIWGIDPDKVREGRPVGHAHFSPDCKHHSKAKGGKPLDKKIRGLVIVMYRWAKVGTRVMTMENVEEIADWGPLYDTHSNGCIGDGTEKRKCNDGCHYNRPIPKHRGRTWQAFLDGLNGGIDPNHPDLPYFLELLGGTVSKADLVNGFGYKYDVRQLRACDYGARTIRKRLFLVARNDGRPIVWPKATHMNPNAPGFAESGLEPWRPVAECIDWDLPCHSIFLSPKAAAKRKCRRPLAESTLRRIAAGIDRYVLKAQRPFLVSLLHQGGNRVESIDEPIKTITAAHRGEKGLVNVTGTIIGAGGRASQSRPRATDEPLHTITAKADTCLAQTTLAPIISDANRPHELRNSAANKPLPTQCAGIKGGHLQLTTASLVGFHGPRSEADNSERVHSLDEPMGTQTTAKRFGVVATSLLQLKGDPATHPASPIDGPAPTQTAAGQHNGLAACYLAQNNFDRVGKDPRDPISTITAKGHQQPVVAANICSYYGSDQVPGSTMDAPCRTIPTTERHSLTLSEAVAPPVTEAQMEGARQVAAFLRTYGVKFEGEFAMVGQFIIVDIGMRMLTPRELFRAQGFPDDYVIDKAWIVDPHTGDINEVELSKEAQIRMCGNSVCPPVAKAIVSANVPELGRWAKGEKRRYDNRKLVTA